MQCFPNNNNWWFSSILSTLKIYILSSLKNLKIKICLDIKEQNIYDINDNFIEINIYDINKGNKKFDNNKIFHWIYDNQINSIFTTTSNIIKIRTWISSKRNELNIHTINRTQFMFSCIFF